MGDRGNVFIRGSRYDVKTRSEKPAKIGIWIYGHWSGYKFPMYVRERLRKAGGYGVSVAALLDEEPGEHTWEVSLSMQDNEYPVVFIDNYNQRVGFTKEPPAPFTTPPDPETWYTFAEFAAMDDATIDRLRSAVKWRR